MNVAGFWAELKRRKVFRVAVVYAATAFVVLQAADILLPNLGAPDWAMRLIVSIAVLAFPIALLLGWALELTPDGVRVTPADGLGADDAAPPPALLGRRTMVVAGLLVAVGMGLGAGLFLSPGAPRGGDANARSGDARAAGHGNGRVSVAVLPFADLSDDRSQEYFGDGIAEELLNTLRSGDIAVASRTSSFAFKGQNVSLREIAGELGVNHVVEGSVRKSGSRLRIAAQVVDVRTDRQLWSQTFDRDAGDIFSIQDEIARSVADALRVRLGATGAAQTAGTRSTEAYDLYLLGLFHWNKRTPEGLRRALEVFEAAAGSDPTFARTWAGVAYTYYVLPEYADFDAALARARGMDAAQRAVRLDPASAETRTALGAWLKADGDFAGALREYDRAIALDPGFPTAHHWRGILLTGLGRLEDAEASLRRAHQLDPASPAIQNFLAEVLDMQRRTVEALAESDALLARVPGYRNSLVDSFILAAQLGRAPEYAPRLRHYLGMIGEDSAHAAIIVAALEDPRLRPDAIAVLEPIAERASAANRFYLVKLFALLGARETTLRMIETDPEWYLLLDRPAFDLVRAEPRFRALVLRRGGEVGG